jgi:HEAT repeat protein
LGEPTVASDMAQLLAVERLHAVIRQSIADALGRLGEPGVTGRLVHLLADERLDADLRRSIADALAAYADDIATVEGMIKSLQDETISNSVYRALWIISRRAGVWIFPVDQTTLNSRNGEQPQAQHEIVRWK